MTTLDTRADLYSQLTVADDLFVMEASRDDAATLTYIRGKMKRSFAEQVAEDTVRQFGRRASIPPNLLTLFMEFLWKDPELQGRFAAFVAAKRITSDDLSEQEK